MCSPTLNFYLDRVNFSILFIPKYFHATEFSNFSNISVAESLRWIESIIFLITFTCTAVLTFNMFVFEMADTITLEIIVAFLDTMLTVGVTFGYFYLSEQITSQLLGIDTVFFGSPWYCYLSAKQQRLLIQPIQRAQLVFRLKGFGVIEASLVVFSEVFFWAKKLMKFERKQKSEIHRSHRKSKSDLTSLSP